MTRHRLVLSTEPRRASIALALLSVAAASSFLVPSAHAGKPAPAPSSVATQITAVVDGLDVPDVGGDPYELVEQGTAFDVDVTLRDAAGNPAAYSTKAATALTVSITAGTLEGALLGGTATAVVPAGFNTASFTNLTLTAPAPAVLTADGVQLTVRATSPVKAARDLSAGTTAAFDVVRDATTQSYDKAKGPLVSAKGAGVPCEATPEAPTCADILLPNGVDSNVFFSAGSGYRCAVAGCDPDEAEGLLLLQVLADLDPLYTAESPATIVFKCDKTLCGGGGVPSKQLWVNLGPTGALLLAPACGERNLMDGPDDFCVDYTQSKRDGSGDTYLYLLLVRDVRMSF